MAWQPITANGQRVYSVRQGSVVPSERAQEVGEHIEKIEADSPITPSVLVEDAESKESVLHEFFEWDNSIASHKWRIQQARGIINHLEIAVVDLREEEEKTTKAWHSVMVVKDDNGDGKSREYVNTVSVMKTPSQREQVLNNALGEIRRWRDRFEVYSEFEPVFSAIDLVGDVLNG